MPPRDRDVLRGQRHRPGAGADLIAHCRETLAHDKCPTTIELRDGLPRTATGKLQKFGHREPYWEGKDRMVNG
jgi:fatty-acyl-CoA synthase